MLRLFSSNYTALPDFFEEITVPEDYGVSEPEMADPEGEGNVVLVPVNALTLSGECLVDLQTTVETLSQVRKHGISLYLYARDIINVDSNNHWLLILLSSIDMSLRISHWAILGSIPFHMAFKLSKVNPYYFRQFLKIAFI